ncbi:uncharacterized protein BXZ73DRAFT_90231 [Epithele typhae]|uniref:uncharacterized protein n=1 Tax=Epithele typhae TaxID=378194 RepID=UPI002007F15C|nr:uncharacterized protein BXZ73DRAFT_90231 [Epithele typhae]KAH9931145.1 hypothetical protein BXZ73DRAFT_90231 [Epithele typhae]
MRTRDIPLEIWHQIIAQACSDGGRTGAAIARVSHFFHNASYPVRFRSLAFSTLGQIHQFFAYIQAYSSSSSQTPKIQHLLLSFSTPTPTTPTPADDVGPALDLADPYLWYRVRQQRELEKAAWDREFTALVSALLALAAPTLETLAVLQSDGHALPALAHAPPLPRLRELTLLMGIAAMLDHREMHLCTQAENSTIPGAVAEVDDPPSNAPAGTRPPGRAPEDGDGGCGCSAVALSERFPALERLHLVCGRHRDWTLADALAWLPRTTPALTHLRVSNAAYTHGRDGRLAAFLARALLPARAPASGSTGGRAIIGARHRALGASPPGPVREPYADYRALVAAVRAVGAACEGGAAGDARVTWVEGGGDAREWEEAIAAQWVDRIEGGLGCWEAR